MSERSRVVEVPVLSELNRERGIPLSMATRAGGLLYLSGLGPLDHRTGELVRGTIEEQTETSLRSIEHVLRAAGSSLDRVVNARIYVTNSGYYDAVNAVYSRFFPVDPPSRTFVTVGSWFGAFDIEIEVVALEGEA